MRAGDPRFFLGLAPDRVIALAYDLARFFSDVEGVFVMTIPELLEAARHAQRIAKMEAGR